MGYLYPPKKSKYQTWYLTPCCGLEVQYPTQTLNSVKGPGSILEINPKWERMLPSFGNFSSDIHSPPPPKKSKYESWYLTPCWGLEMQNPTQALNSVNRPGNMLPSFGTFSWDIHSTTPKKIKYQSWYLTPCCGFEVQNTTQALK